MVLRPSGVLSMNVVGEEEEERRQFSESIAINPKDVASVAGHQRHTRVVIRLTTSFSNHCRGVKRGLRGGIGNMCTRTSHITRQSLLYWHFFNQ